MTFKRVLMYTCLDTVKQAVKKCVDTVNHCKCCSGFEELCCYCETLEKVKKSVHVGIIVAS